MAHPTSLLWLAVAAAIAAGASYQFRYEVFSGPGASPLPINQTHQVVWDRWNHRLCIAVMFDKGPILCSLEELESFTKRLR